MVGKRFLASTSGGVGFGRSTTEPYSVGDQNARNLGQADDVAETDTIGTNVIITNGEGKSVDEEVRQLQVQSGDKVMVDDHDVAQVVADQDLLQAVQTQQATQTNEVTQTLAADQNTLTQGTEQVAQVQQQAAEQVQAVQNQDTQAATQNGGTGVVIPTGLYTMSAPDIDGNLVMFSKFAGKVTLVVSVASQCGYTESNYAGLNALYRTYAAQGLEILAFPCNNWNQETGTNENIKEFVRTQKQSSFPLLAKTDVIGEGRNPIFAFLTDNLPRNLNNDPWQPKWNFSKWLVNRHGLPIKAYDSAMNVHELETDIVAELGRV